jgi:hypothetical protein
MAVEVSLARSKETDVGPSERDESKFTFSFFKIRYILIFSYNFGGYAVAQLVEALRYKPEGREFDSWWGRRGFSLT